MLDALISLIVPLVRYVLNLAPVTNVECVDFLPKENAFLLRIEVVPQAKKITFDEISVDGCMLRRAVRVDKVRDTGGVVWIDHDYVPDKSQSPASVIHEALEVAPKEVSSMRIERYLFAVPQSHLKATRVRFFSSDWWMSTSCRVALNPDV